MKLNKFILPIAAIFFATQAAANPYIGASYLYSEYQVKNENTDFSDQTAVTTFTSVTSLMTYYRLKVDMQISSIRTKTSSTSILMLG